MKNKNGFTLVELLAVIVVLAIIMIIAIPSVLNVTNSSKRSAFVLYAEKIIIAVETRYVYDANESLSGAGYYVYDIKTDIGLHNVGDFNGYVVVNASNIENPEYILYLYDKNYMITNYNVTKFGSPTTDGSQIRAIDNSVVKQVAGSAAQACESTAGPGVACYNKNGALIVKGA